MFHDHLAKAALARSLPLGKAMTHARTSLGVGGWFFCLVAGWACGGAEVLEAPTGETDEGVLAEPATPIPVPGDAEFTSSGGGERWGEGVPGEIDEELRGLSDYPTLPPSDDAAARARSDADILRHSGDRLYTLTRRGLTIIDVADPAQPRVAGEHRAAAQPFELLIADGLGYALFNGWLSPVCDEQGACTWQAASHVQALDMRDPSQIRVLAEVTLPGQLAAARRVGNVLYLATEQPGSCWGCEAEPNTTITSLDLSDPGRLTQLQQARAPAPRSQSRDGHSVLTTDQRLYITRSPRDDQGDALGPSQVQVVDIGAPGGAITIGARFELAGFLGDRRQMDEYDGVLRSVSQPVSWNSQEPAVLQTFRVSSSSDVQPLASLPVPPSVWLDGPRLYARGDTLNTFDLSDPAAPRQAGTLDTAGRLYHVEPAGKRVYTLAQGDEPSLIRVSLFDVEDVAQPALLGRVEFGGDPVIFDEQPNRMAQPASILADAGLLLVPLRGARLEPAPSCGDVSGIQLIGVTATTLTTRGLARSIGGPGRMLAQAGTLIGIDEDTVQTYDIQDRDAPIGVGRAEVARAITGVRRVGDRLLRFGFEGSTWQSTVDLTAVERAGAAEPELDLTALLGEAPGACGRLESTSGGFTRGAYTFVSRHSEGYDEVLGDHALTLGLYAFDLGDAATSRAAGSVSLTIPTDDGERSAGVFETDRSLLAGRRRGIYDPSGQSAPEHAYDVVDLGEPGAPRVAIRFEVPEPVRRDGWGHFFWQDVLVDSGSDWARAEALVEGNLLIGQHAQRVADYPRRLRYQLDRFDMSTPSQPRELPPINIPGTVLHFDAGTNELITLDHRETVERAANEPDCTRRGHHAYSDGSPGNCRVTRRSLNSLVIDGDRAVLTSRIELDDARYTAGIAVSGKRIYFTSRAPLGPDSVGEAPAGAPSGAAPSTGATTAVLLEAVELQQGVLARLASHELYRAPPGARNLAHLIARGDRVFAWHDTAVSMLDMTVPEAPTRLSVPAARCQALTLAGDVAYCTSLEHGVEVVDLSVLR